MTGDKTTGDTITMVSVNTADTNVDTSADTLDDYIERLIANDFQAIIHRREEYMGPVAMDPSETTLVDNSDLITSANLDSIEDKLSLYSIRGAAPWAWLKDQKMLVLEVSGDGFSVEGRIALDGEPVRDYNKMLRVALDADWATIKIDVRRFFQ